MLMLQTKLRVAGITAREIFDFLADPNDQAYQEWWPGTHLQLHPLKRRSPTRSSWIQGSLHTPGPLIRLYFSEKFAAALDDHVKTEFPLLGDRLPQIKPELGAR